MTERTYCSQANPEEPMLGTADVVDVWLLLEYRPVWKARAIDDNELSESVQRWLADGIAALRASGLRVRPQMIRQPEIDRSDTRLLVHHEGVLREFGSGQAGYDDLVRTPIELLVGDSTLGAAVDAPRYFVCTNGRRDLCCARFGLPAYGRLRELVGERAWQTTHLGGHRFAPNVLVLPQGTLYGRVTPEETEAFVAEVENGGLPAGMLRGRSRYPKLVQAAEGFAGRAGLRLLKVDGDEGQAVVSFAHAQETLRVAIRRSREPFRTLASCGDEESKTVCPFVKSTA
ncbi:MAG: hypothetical protein OXP09_05595 [Gammaproteobacteria bacterium]|nr:hypothetical protein [Gammaproteobacteria bacterium]